MPYFPLANRRPGAALAAGAALVLALSACQPAGVPDDHAGATHRETTAKASAHVHGLSVSSSGQVLLATHDGLFDVTTRQANKIGATNDLMGFTAGSEPGEFYASGHPGPGSTLPNPMGLIKSVDGGQSWEQLSRQGESDFHAMTATKSGIVAFDGAMLTSPDGRTWTPAAADFAPANLAGSPDSDTVLATAQDGPRRSADGGRTWTRLEGAPVIQFAAFAGPQVAFGVEPDGTVHYSADAGSTWTAKGRIAARVQAIAATASGGEVRLWAATPDGIVVSGDDGSTFTPAGG